jgi:hypothetical protein
VCQPRYQNADGDTYGGCGSHGPGFPGVFSRAKLSANGRGAERAQRRAGSDKRKRLVSLLRCWAVTGHPAATIMYSCRRHSAGNRTC